MALHNHLALNGHTFHPPKDEETIKAWLTSLVAKLDMKILQGPYVSYVAAKNNRGFTAVVMIETSHMAIHIWDEQSPAFVEFDVYTCGELNPQLIVDDLVQNIGLIQDETLNMLVLERSGSFRTIPFALQASLEFQL